MQVQIHFYLFYTSLIHKSNKASKKLLSGLKISLSHHLSLQLDLQILRLDDLSPECQETFYYNFVMTIIKLNDFRHLCHKVYSKEVSVPRFVNFVTVVSLRCWKKISKKLNPGVSTVYSSESEDPAQKYQVFG